MRLNEPMFSVLDGDWIDIPNTSKGKVGRNIQLDRPMQSIFNELNEWLSSGYGSKKLRHLMTISVRCLRKP